MENYQGLRVLVLGLGVSGQAAANLLLNLGAHVGGYDDNINLPLPFVDQGLHIISSFKELFLYDFDCAIVSPGISPRHSVYSWLKEKGVAIVGEVELGLSMIKNRCIGITGTNGKTTVTLLITHLLSRCGIAAHALGNIGRPICSEVLRLNKDEVVVVELSSFQLETMQSKVLDQAFILNVTPDHLDRYSSMQEYAEAKFQIACCLKAGGEFFIQDRAHTQYSVLGAFFSMSIFGVSNTSALQWKDQCIVDKRDEITFSLQGLNKRTYHFEHFLVAYACLRSYGITVEQLREGLEDFEFPNHRMKTVRTYKGVTYINDSKATNVDSMRHALENITGDVILLAGGKDKGGSYQLCKKAILEKVRKVFIFGEAADKMLAAWETFTSVTVVASLKEAVTLAAQYAKKGETVLLSPGCSSFDMFKSYEERGTHFCELVDKI